jgi:tetratricopeptide (TPR) repeat protein
MAMVALLEPALGRPQEATRGTPEAKAEYEKGEVARKKEDFKAAVEDYRQAIELDPNYAEGREMYIFASQQAATSEVRAAAFSAKASAKERAEYKKSWTK